MKAALLVLAVVGAALLAPTLASARQTCTPGGTAAMRTYCGPATGKLRVQGKTYVFKHGGNCTISGGTFELNIGTITLVGKPKHEYLGITVFSTKAGTHDAAVSWQLHGKTISLSHAKVTVARGRKKGTFTGSVHAAGKASGSFSCK